MSKENIYIIGGGISGCAFAYFLKKDFNVVIYEKSPELGGLITTRYNLEGIPWQQVSGILHTNKKWIVDLFSKYSDFFPIDYQVAMDPLFDFRYYNYPFNKSTIDTMPWHWKEAILKDLEISNGHNADTMEELITNFYGDTVYNIFYRNYFKRLFGVDKIDLTGWYRPYMRDVYSNFTHYIDEYVLFPKDGWNGIIQEFSSGVEIKNKQATIQDFTKDDIVIFTGDVTQFFDKKDKLYSYGSFDIDSTPYKQNSPDTIIYPNYTPFIQMTQFGKMYSDYEKNIIVKIFIDDGDIPLYPIPLKSKQKQYNKIVQDNPNVIFAGRSGSWSFLDIDGVMEQAQVISAKIKHSRRQR